MSQTHTILSTIFKNAKKVKSLEGVIEKSVPEDQLSAVLYGIYGQHLAGVASERIEQDIKQRHWLWESSSWEPHRQGQKDLDDFISTPMEVVSGVMKCEKCKSDKVYTIQKQLRSADEGFSSISQCLNCGARWRIN
jgi:DNA-directed RNA polymerase subunit M/transcription elongation factor TFIIS